MGQEESIIKQTILKANTFIDFNKLFNLFHFLKLKIDLEPAPPQSKVSMANCTLRSSTHSAIGYGHLSEVSGGFISFFFYFFLFLRSLNKLGGPPAGHTAAGSRSEPHL